MYYDNILIYFNLEVILKTLIVPNKYNGKKLCNFILTSFPNLSQNILYKALRQKDIKINGKRVNM